ncbi:hypothetical protein E2C01_093084 [Portunus trituberculatus]|uniref:Uncharacterized protein n=1 Tax=Portunus trituberculatus TaxID=210409 RepID=A0A5B7JT38_PORTR|nr:hypothetical protein [Portunus trituberculatus]
MSKHNPIRHCVPNSHDGDFTVSDSATSNARLTLHLGSLAMMRGDNF